MVQRANLGPIPPSKRQSLSLNYSHDPPILTDASYPGAPNKNNNLLAALKHAPQEHTQEDRQDCPDGGLQAWLVVLGASCATFSTCGYANSWGVFQSYYENDLLKGTSPSTIAWIGSIQFSFIFIPALIAGRLFDLGYLRSTIIVSSINLVLCTVLVAECHQYWQFLLCQGFGTGISCGLAFGPVTSAMAHWFEKRRSTALGILAFASSIGGTVFPVIFHNLLVTVGFKWTMRIIAAILGVAMGITNLTIRRRLPPTTLSGGLLNLKQFRSPAYTVYTASGFVSFLGLYTVLTFIDASAPSQGVPDSFSSYLVSIANAGNAVGRLSSGILADRFGPINVMIPTSFVAGVLTFIWPYLRGTSALIALAVTYGMSSGAMAALLPAPMMGLGESDDVGRRLGMYLTIASLGALAGPPISGAINHYTGRYIAVAIFAGCTVMVGVSLLVLSRYFVLRGWRGRA